MWVGALVLLGGALVLTGWALDIPLLMSVRPNWVSMKANSALSFVLIGLTLLLLSPAVPLAGRLPAGLATRVAQGCSLLVGMFGLLTVVEYATGLSLGIDQLLVREAPGMVGTSHPGRMAFDTALSFAFLGAAAVLVSMPRKTRMLSLASVVLSMVVTTLAFEVVVSYFGPNPEDYGRWGATVMAAPTALLLVVTGMGVAGIAVRRSALDWSLGRRTGATFVFGLAILLFVGTLATRTLAQLTRMDRRAELAARIDDVSEAVLAQVEQAQASTRGFIISGDSRSLGSYDAAADSARASLALLRKLIADSTERRQQVSRIGARVDTALVWWRGSIVRGRASGLDAAAQRTRTNHGDDLMDALREEITRFEAREDQRYNARRQQSVAAVRFSQVIIGTGTIIGLGTLLLVFLGLNRAVADERKAEALLRDSNEFLENLFNRTNAPIVVWNPAFVITRFNGAFEALTGRAASDVLGQPVTALFPPGQSGAAMARIGGARQGERWQAAEIEVLRADGSVRTLLWSSGDVKAADGRTPIATIAQGIDITERKAAEDALRTSEERYHSLFDSMIEGYAHCQIVLEDGVPSDFIYLEVNAAFRTLTGLENVAGKRVTEVIPGIRASNPELFEAYGNAALTGKTAKFETYVEPLGIWFALTVYGTSKGHFVVVFDNISERKAAEARLQQTLAELERSNKDLEQFAYVASHDLQEPLRMVSSYTQLLGKRYEGQLDEKARKYIAYAVDGAVRMQRLINDLLTFSRVGTRGQALADSDTHAILGEAIANLGAAIAETNALITSDDLPVVCTDASQLSLVFQNLISNGIKFHGTTPPRVHVSAQDRGSEWMFSVRDNGIGIEPQYASRLFVIFQRLHTREAYPGTGIGLALCKRIVERHHGRIWFESEPGTGSTFYFTLPKSPGA